VIRHDPERLMAGRWRCPPAWLQFHVAVTPPHVAAALFTKYRVPSDEEAPAEDP
jgi:hypothetical protein